MPRKSIHLTRQLCLFAVFSLSILVSTSSAQSIHQFQNGSGLLFNNLPRTNFEPKLRTNFENFSRIDSGVRFGSKASATRLRLTRQLARLKAQLPEERKYIDELITLVEQKKIPEVLVNEAFFYTLKRYRGRFPFPYFEHILRLQAGRLKFKVPNFDRKIYSKEKFAPQIFNR